MNAYERLMDNTPGLSKWRIPCGDAFTYLATNYPEKLLCLIESRSLSSANLTFAVEIAGRRAWSAETKQVLMFLLAATGDDPLVAEGVILGLAEHLDDGGVQARLEDYKTTTKDKTLREVLEDVLS